MSVAKDVLSQFTKQENQLNNLVKASKRLLYKCETVFPFTLFPDMILIDQNKIDIIYRNFFFSKSVFTLMIDDVRTVKVSAGPFFASMNFEVVGYEQNPAPVRFLPKASAFKMRRIIMGLTAAKREGIDLDNMSKQQVKQKIQEIGAAQEQLTGV